MQGGHTVRARTLGHILLGCLLDPRVASLMARGIHFVIHLRYIP